MVYPHKASIYIISYYIFSPQNTLPPAGKLQKSGWLSHTWSLLPLINAILSDSDTNRDIKDIYRCRNQATLRNMAQYALKWGEFLELMFRALAFRNSK